MLVVDDNATSRGILEEMLTSWDMRPTSVADANEALDTAQRAQTDGRPFPVVIIDANMPRIDGFELVERLRQLGEKPPAVVMLLSSGSRAGDVARCERLGVAAYVMKPVKQSELLDTLLVIVDPPRIEDELAGDAEDAAVRPLRILLAEDTLVNQRLAVGLLERQGHVVVVANNGVAALTALEHATLRSERFDLVLMDVQMPEMDGLEATVQIRQREQSVGGHVPIIAMTARAMKGDRERCLAAGMDGYLSKPIRSKDLLAAIQAVLEVQGMRNAESDRTSNIEHPTSNIEPFDVGRSMLDVQCSTSEPVDWPAARKTVGGDERLLRLVVEACLEEYPRLLAQLREAVGRRDAAAVCQAAHAIKGSIRTFGATRAFDLAYQLETMGRVGDLGRATEVLQAAEQEFDRLLSALREYLGREG